jgi:hypothetical protein
MFSKAFVATLALVGAVSALPSPNGGSTTSGPQCCQNVTNSSQLDPSTAGVLAGLLGVVVSGLNVPIGTGCTPIDILGGVSCNTNTVQCGQVFEGKPLPLCFLFGSLLSHTLSASLIGVNCVPVILNL